MCAGSGLSIVLLGADAGKAGIGGGQCWDCFAPL